MTQTFLNRKFRYSYTNITFKLIAVNIGVFIVTSLFPRLYAYIAMIPQLVIQKGWYWQLFTYMFVHANFSHILFNMLGLFIFGMPVERELGSKEFLLFYLLTGFLSGAFSLFFYFISATNVILVGASGAIYAVLFSFAVLYPYARVFIFGLLPIRAPLLIALYTAIEIFSQLTGRGGGVAHLTHLAGFAFAYLYFILRLKINPMDRWRRR